MKKKLFIILFAFSFLTVISFGQGATCSECSNFNCAFDGITGECRVNCGVNYTYSVGGPISQTPSITGGTLVSYSGSTFTINWDCNATSGTMEVRYIRNGHTEITEGQVCICPSGGSGGGGSGGGGSNYCEQINLNCAFDGISGPCNVIAGSSASYSVAPPSPPFSGKTIWRVSINGSISQYMGTTVTITWPAPGLYVAEIEVIVGGVHFTEGQVCVDSN